MKNFFTRVEAYTTLPDGNDLYEANANLQCGQCGATIPANSYFARKLIARKLAQFRVGKRVPWQHCRVCFPFDIYTSRNKVTIASREDEYLYVSEEGQC